MTKRQTTHKENQNEESNKARRREEQAQTSPEQMFNDPGLAVQQAGAGLPPHQTNLRLRQGAVLQMQRTYGNSYVQRRMSSSNGRNGRVKSNQRPLSSINGSHNGVVQRDPNWNELMAQFGTVGNWSAPDMVETDWATMGFMAGLMTEIPQSPAEVQMALPQAVPAAPSGTTRGGTQQPNTGFNCPTGRCHPSHHQTPDRFDRGRFEQIELSLDRQRAWQAISQKVSGVQTGWNRLVPMITAYNNAQDDATLQNPEMGMQAFQSGQSGDLGQLADQQNVPRTGSSRTSLGSLFSGENNTELNLNRSDNRAIDRAANNPAVATAVLSAQEADANVKTAVSNVRAKIRGVETALHSVSTASANLQLARAENEQETAQSSYNSAVSARDGMKANVKDLLDLTKGLVSVAGGDASALWDIAGLAANRIVDASYANRISQAKRRLDRAISQVQGARITAGAAALREAQSAVTTALAELTTARDGVKAPLIARRNAYNNLATVASSRSGGGSQSRSRIAGAIAAIPPTEVVVQRISAMSSAASGAVGDASYSRDSGIGYTMAQQNGQEQTMATFVTHYGGLRALNLMMNGKKAHWEARLQSLRAIITRLGGLGGGGTSGQ
ncbi:MAG: hypothetical protein GY796_30160 [Chloroflexi bacterium]|nr:hypothetical protein [Chloroflexota bacterium]